MREVRALPYFESVFRDCWPLRRSSNASRKVSVALSKSSELPVWLGMRANQSPKHFKSNCGSSIWRAEANRPDSLVISLLGEAGGDRDFGDELLDGSVLARANVMPCSLNLYRS